MVRNPTQRRKCVSESVAAVLLISIALSAGVLIYLAFLNTIAESQDVLARELMRAETAAGQYLDILYVHYNNTRQQLEIVVVSGAYPVNLYSVYVDKHLVADYGGAYTVSGSSIEKLVIDYPNLESGQHLVEVVYEGGKVVYVLEM